MKIKTIQPLNISTVQRIKAEAFTLAETLIVIGIIGVVAALTLPNLNHATGDKERVTRVKKIYSSLTDAFDRAQVIYGNANEWYNGLETDDCEESSIRFMDRITEFMKVSKVNEDTCYGCSDRILLSDGMSFGVHFHSGPDDSIYINNAEYLGIIYVDIDGPNKGKNRDGEDRFTFDITSVGLYPEELIRPDYDEDENNTRLQNMCFRNGYCAQWVIQNDNMDYLKADDDGVCPNGGQLSWTATDCSSAKPAKKKEGKTGKTDKKKKAAKKAKS